MKDSRPLILVSNDDGYNFPGIKALVEVALEFGDVIVVAPLVHQSGKASSITTHEPLRAYKMEERDGLVVYAVNGTPADCAKLGFGELVGDHKVDLLLSGVNHGHNDGNSVIYSGTLGVVFEGAMAGLPSVAFSLDDYNHDACFDNCLPIMRHIIKRVLDNGLPSGVCLNVNMPKCEHIEGVKTTITAPGQWSNAWDRRTAPHGFDYYWMLGEYDEDNPDDNRTDTYWLRHNYVSVTPLHVDQTDFGSLQLVDDLLKGM